MAQFADAEPNQKPNVHRHCRTSLATALHVRHELELIFCSSITCDILSSARWAYGLGYVLASNNRNVSRVCDVLFATVEEVW